MFFAFLLLLASCNKSNNPKPFVDDFFNAYQSGNIVKALDNLFDTNKWFTASSNGEIEKLKNDMPLYLTQLGEYYGYNLISEKTIGESFVIYTYLVKYERQPLRFTFIFYKPNNNWVLYNFKYDDNIENELSESSKWSYL
jgi:hypothetical protein